MIRSTGTLRYGVRRVLRDALPTLLLALLLPGCAPLQQLLSGTDAAERLAAQVTITRDEWGVPHIQAETDAAALFGVAWAQAEDAFWQIEENYLRALGRAAEWHGESRLAADAVRAAFEVERLSRAEYEREPPERRALWDAYAAGLNHYVRATGVRTRLIGRFEPWMPFALMRDVEAGMVIDGLRLGVLTSSGGITLTAAVEDDEVAQEVEPPMSVAWAVAPARTAAGHALLVQSRHVSFIDAGQPLEVHLRSASGWHVRGVTDPGVPLPLAGHNERLAWAHTHSSADRADVYVVAFDDPADPLAYRYDGEWRRAVEWQDTLLVNTATGLEPRVLRFRRTHHGPIAGQREGRAHAVRIARMEEGGALQQWMAMGRARDLEQFRAALEERALPALSTLFADADGNIYYVDGSAVPVRDPAIDWTRPVDGSTSASEWLGFHAVSDLPQLLNPASGWIQAAGPGPFHATSGVNPDSARFPSYMARAADSPRARAVRRLLESDSAWTLDASSRTAFDTQVGLADNEILALAQEWEVVGGRNPARARQLDEVMDTLRAWDGVASTGSTATTLFVLWQERMRNGGYSGELVRFHALEDAAARLQRDSGSAFIEWGTTNRLQRVQQDGAQTFSDTAPSLPIAGVPGWAGVVFDVRAARPAGATRRYATAGPGWVNAVELGPAVRSLSVLAFGQSADPASPHYFDQAALFARAEPKPAHFAQSEVEAHARRTYGPDAVAR